MKQPVYSMVVLMVSSVVGLAQQPSVPSTPEVLKPQFALLKDGYPKVDTKKFPKAPADSVWLFRSLSSASGTVEVAFQDADVVYMIFRRGTGGIGWKPADIKALHLAYYKELLKETYDPGRDVFSRYNHAVASQINAATITRKDFDAKTLLSGS
jgi:hypothetical protein